MLRDVVRGLEHSELMKIKKDLDAGAIHIRKLINSQIKENEKQHEAYCATCMAKIDPQQRSNFTLLFGPDDFKKKASFCGMDCLEYFLQKLKKIEIKR
jgi:hypothetical protein